MCGNRAGIYLYNKQYDKAIAGYTRAIEIRPEQSWGYARRGNAYYELKKYELALSDYNKAIELDPTNANFFYYRGSIYTQQGHSDLAIKDLDKAIELDPTDADAYFERGRTYSRLGQLGDIDKAIIDYTQAIKIGEEFTYYMGRANAYLERGQDTLASEDYTKSIELYPDRSLPYLARGYVYTRQRHYDLAIKDLDKAIKFANDDARGYKMRGYVYLQLSRHELAVADLTRAIELDPDDATSYYNRSGALRALGQEERATQDYKKTFELDPEYVEKSQSFASAVVSRVIFFIVAVFLGTFILRFAMSRNFGRTPRFVPGTNISPQPSYALASGVVVVAYLLTHGIIELLRYIVFPAMGLTFLNGGVGFFLQ